jgi:hypothetical protein
MSDATSALCHSARQPDGSSAVRAKEMKKVATPRQRKRGKLSLLLATLIASALTSTVAFAGEPATSFNSSIAIAATGNQAGDSRSIEASLPIKKVSGGSDAVIANPRGTSDLFVAQVCCSGGNGWAPGEPSIAVGQAHIVETVNSSLTVYAKSATPPAEVFHQDLTSFFGGGPIACVDPRVIYWSWSDRYALVCTDIGSVPNVVRFAVTTGNDPTQSWNEYVINSGFLDQPKIEATADKLIVAGNGNGEQFYVYQLADILAGASDPAVVHLTSSITNLYQAAVEYTPTSAGYFVGAYACAGCTVSLATITGVPETSVSLTETSLGNSQLRSTTDPAVPGGTLGGAMDTRVLTAAYEVEASDNQPVIQYSANTECTLGGRDTVCTAAGRITWSGSTPVLSYVKNEGRANAAYTFGAVTLDGYGDVYLSYSRSSSTSTPSAAVLAGRPRLHGHPFDTIIQSSVSGTSACAAFQVPPCDERWGDYMGATQDPADPSYVWVAGLYQAASGLFGWGTVIARAHINALG